MACKRAVKGGERLPQVEIEDLVKRATESGVTPTCPHGRPLVISITHQDLDKRFKRVQ
jgi:DNA mismatch repair protein MutL